MNIRRHTWIRTHRANIREHLIAALATSAGMLAMTLAAIAVVVTR